MNWLSLVNRTCELLTTGNWKPLMLTRLIETCLLVPSFFPHWNLAMLNNNLKRPTLFTVDRQNSISYETVDEFVSSTVRMQ